jgi:hypothetical protein
MRISTSLQHCQINKNVEGMGSHPAKTACNEEEDPSQRYLLHIPQQHPTNFFPIFHANDVLLSMVPS